MYTIIRNFILHNLIKGGHIYVQTRILAELS